MWQRKKLNIKLNCVNKRVPVLCLFYFLDKRNTSLISENMYLGQYLQMHPQNYIHSKMCSSISYNDHSYFCTGLKPAVLCLGLCLLVWKYIYARKTFFRTHSGIHCSCLCTNLQEKTQEYLSKSWKPQTCLPFQSDVSKQHLAIRDFVKTLCKCMFPVSPQLKVGAWQL